MNIINSVKKILAGFSSVIGNSTGNLVNMFNKMLFHGMKTIYCNLIKHVVIKEFNAFLIHKDMLFCMHTLRCFQ
jgi:hypothetical protein